MMTMTPRWCALCVVLLTAAATTERMQFKCYFCVNCSDQKNAEEIDCTDSRGCHNTSLNLFGASLYLLYFYTCLLYTSDAADE